MYTTKNSSDSQTPASTGDSTPEIINSQGNKHTKKIPKWLYIIAAIIILGLGAFLVFRPDSKDEDKNNSKQGNNNQPAQANNTPAFLEQYGRACKDRPITLSASPIPLTQLGHIEPLGKVQDGHVTPTDHLYVSPKSMQAADNTTDVVMPADGTVVEIGAMPSQYIGDRQQQTAPEDHRLVIAHSCRYFSIFIHVHKLSATLASAVGALEPNSSKQVSIELKAGDVLGKIGGNPVDWTYVDTTKTLRGFVTPNLYKGEPWKIHTVDPLALYNGDLKTKLEAASLRSKAPLGGKIDYDMKGALIGNWFREGTAGYSGTDQSRYWDGHLSIAPDYIDATTNIVSIGNWDGKAAQYAVKGAFDASKITKASGLTKVELIQRSYTQPNGTSWQGNAKPTKGLMVAQDMQSVGTILFEVQDGEKLKVEKFIGKSPAQVSGFTASAQTYVR